MRYEITEQRKAYLNARGYTILSACPGSGKTTSIVKKLFDVSRFCKETYGNHTGFACLSFTNKACDELKGKYNKMHGETLSYPDVVSTIDSFIMQNVILPFWHLSSLCKNRPMVVNEKNVLAQIYKNKLVLDGKLVETPIMNLRGFGSLNYRKPPEDVVKVKEGFRIGYQGLVTDEKTLQYCEVAFEYRLSKGFMTSQDALWLAIDILSQNDYIAKILVKRFPYIIVDEAQDNSDLQFNFFELLKKAGLQNLEYVGDICQSIYGFRGAYPDALADLMEKKDVWNTFHFTECRRSTQCIIDFYSKLKPNFIPPIKSCGVVDLKIPILVFRYGENNKKEIVRKFQSICENKNLRDHYVLARGENFCKELAGVQQNKFRCWKSIIPYLLIEARLYYENGKFEKAFRKIRIALGELLFSFDEMPKKKNFLLDIEKDFEWNKQILMFLKLIPSLSFTFEYWTKETQQLLKEFWSLSEAPDFQVHKRATGFCMKEMLQKPVEEVHRPSNVDANDEHRIRTIHSVKGASFEAVLLFLSKNSKGEDISLNDFAKKTNMTDAQRLIYVACSRAKYLLALAIPDEVSEKKLGEVMKGVEYRLEAHGGTQLNLCFDYD